MAKDDTEVKNKKKVKKDKDEKKVKKDKKDKEETLDELIKRIVSETVPGEGAEMFDDWNELAPHYLDNVVPGEEGGEFEVIGD